MPRVTLADLRREFPPMLRLAFPLVVAEVGWMTMGVLDTLMVGRLPDSAVAMGAIGIGNISFFAFAICGVGMLFGIDPMVSQAFGGKRIADCHRTLWSAVLLCFPLAAIVMAIVYAMPWVLSALGTNPQVLPPTTAYLRAILWGALPVLLYHSFRAYLQAMNQVKVIMFALITANVVNAAGNWLLIYGHWGFPAWGVKGSAVSTVVALVYLALCMMLYAMWHDRRERHGLFAEIATVHGREIRELLRLGGPAAGQILGEIGVWGTSTLLVGKLDAVSLAGHQVAVNVASLLFMVPLGIGQAGSVRVGQALGAGHGDRAATSGWAALAIGAIFASFSALALVFFGGPIARIYTPDRAVRQLAARLLIPCACFEVFDALQVTSAGVLRGAGNTRTAMTAHLIVYWLFGLPLGYALCFRAGWGAMGIWIGLSSSIVIIGCILAWAWNQKQRTFAAVAPRMQRI